MWVLAVLAFAFAAGDVRAHGDAHREAPGGVAPPATSAAAEPAAPPPPEQQPFGVAGDPVQVTRTIRVGMSDAMRFHPASIDVRLGETVRFVVRNRGRAFHELVIGTKAALAEHAEMMRKHPGMEHDEPYMTHVSSGRSSEIVWKFNRPGTFHYACLVAGHFESGMVGTVRVR
jgi:uncharacterized cupredoxin-like copper-binding protein